MRNMNYMKRPVIVQAVQWDGTNFDEVKELDQPDVRRVGTTVVDGVTKLRIATLEGVMTASIGDWVIRGVRNELYLCKPDTFAETYDHV